MSIFRRLFSGRRERVRLVHVALRLPQSLTLGKLIEPVFPYTAPNDRVNEIAGDSQLHPAITARGSIPFEPSTGHEYLRILQDAADSCPKEDLP